MDASTDTVLSQKLRELPQIDPPANGWQLIQAQMALAAPREKRRWLDGTAWLGMAASAVLAAVLLTMEPPRPATVVAPGQVAIDADVLALMQRSQALEADIRRASTPDVDEFRFAIEAAIQDELTLVDVGLASTAKPDRTLWAERVRLLEELRTVSQTDTGTLLMQASVD